MIGPAGTGLKRTIDLAIVFVAAPFWLPVYAIVAGLTRLNMGAPILYNDMRSGKGGKPFAMRKFRTMLIGDAPDEERLTKFGRFLRKTSMDELPELFNVIRGEMTLIGPRPLPVRYLPRYSEFAMRRHEVVPGITGWAQVNGRNALEWNEKFRYDVEYVDKWSVWLDIKILFMTAMQVIFPRHINHDGAATMTEFTGDKQ